MYPAVLLMYFISVAVILLASLALIVQVSLPYNNTGRALGADIVGQNTEHFSLPPTSTSAVYLSTVLCVTYCLLVDCMVVLSQDLTLVTQI